MIAKIPQTATKLTCARTHFNALRPFFLDSSLLHGPSRKYLKLLLGRAHRPLPPLPKPLLLVPTLIATSAAKPEWLFARCAALLALNTTMQGCELKGLRLRNVNLIERTVVVKRETTKTNAGARVIPLNRDAVLALGELLSRLTAVGVDKPDSYLFPACESGHIDPDKPMRSWRTA